MTNYYQTERYPFHLIHAFATSQRNLNHSLTPLWKHEMDREREIGEMQ